MNNEDMKQLGISAHENLCNDLMPISEAKGELEGSDTEDSVEPSPADGILPSLHNNIYTLGAGDKPKRSCKRKVYPTLAVWRSARVTLKRNSMMIYEGNLLE